MSCMVTLSLIAVAFNAMTLSKGPSADHAQVGLTETGRLAFCDRIPTTAKTTLAQVSDGSNPLIAILSSIK